MFFSARARVAANGARFRCTIGLTLGWICVDCVRGACTISFFSARDQMASLRFCLQRFTAGQWRRYTSVKTPANT